MSCVAWPNQTPIGTASIFLQCKWVSCSKSYWQGYDLGWYKDMGPPCFPQPNLWLARCASMSWTALKKFVVLSTHELRTGKKHSFHCGRKAWQVLSVLRLRRLLCLFRLAPSCRLRRLARWWWRRWWAQRHNRAMRPQCFIPTSQKHSLSLLGSPAECKECKECKEQQGAARSSKEQQGAATTGKQ